MDKQEMIQVLTGVKSSKRNYYPELKRTISQLEKKNLQLEIISEVMRNMKVDMPVTSILEKAMGKLRSVIQFDCLGIALFERGELRYSPVPAEKSCKPEWRVLPRVKDSLFWKAAAEKQPIYFSRNMTAKQLPQQEKALIKENGITSLLLIPLMSKNEAAGVVSFGRSTDLFWEEGDLSFLGQLSDYLSVGIENASLYQEVLRVKREWEDTIAAVVDALIVVDEHHRILRCNDAAKKFLDRGIGPLEGQKPCRILSCMAENCDCLIAECFETKKIGYRQIPIKNGRICEAHTYPMFQENGEMSGVIIYLKDVTERLEIEAQLIHSGKLAAIGELAAGVAHELNSPLTAILGNSQILLRDYPSGNTAGKLLNDINNCGLRCKTIIRSLLTFSRQDQYILASVSVNAAVRQVLDFVTYQIEREGIKLVLNLTEGLPSIQASIQHIEQVFINLLLNAKDALEESDVSGIKIISVQSGAREIEGREWVFLAVRDNGKGMSEHVKQEAFTPFFTTKESKKGTGLGLSVSLGIAKAHGGMLSIQSQPGEGSIVELLLPAGEE